MEFIGAESLDYVLSVLRTRDLSVDRKGRSAYRWPARPLSHADRLHQTKQLAGRLLQRSPFYTVAWTEEISCREFAGALLGAAGQ